MNDATGWRLTANGLRLKVIAAVVLLIVPALAFVGSGFGHSGAIFAAAGIVGATCLDLCGRCLCLAAPVRRRYSIVLSVALHSAAVAAIVALTILERDLGLYVGLVLAACIQVFVAGLFTLFLGEVALALNRPDLQAGVSRLQVSLATGTIVGTTTVGYVFVVAAAVVFFGLFSYGLGFCIGIPMGILAIAPWIVIAVIPFTLMFVAYGKSVTEIRRAALAATRSFDANVLDPSEIRFLPKQNASE